MNKIGANELGRKPQELQEPEEPKELGHSNEHVSAVLNYLQSIDDLSESESRRHYFEQIDGVAMLDHIRKLRSLVETGDGVVPHKIDGEGVRTGSLQPPCHEDKEKLVISAWDVVREHILSSEKYSTSEALTYAGLVMGGAVVLTHMFGDGNGRVSRILAHELMKGAETSNEEVLDLLTNGEKSLYVRPPQDFGLRKWPLKLNNADDALFERMNEYITAEEFTVASEFQHKTDNDHLTSMPGETFSEEEQYERECYRKFLAAGFMAWLDEVRDNPVISPNNELTKEFYDKNIQRMDAIISGYKQELQQPNLNENRRSYLEGRIKKGEAGQGRRRDIVRYLEEHYGVSGEWKIPYLEQYRLRSLMLTGKPLDSID